MHGDVQGAHRRARQSQTSVVTAPQHIQCGEQWVGSITLACCEVALGTPAEHPEGGAGAWQWPGCFANLPPLVFNTHRPFQGFITTFTF